MALISKKTLVPVLSAGILALSACSGQSATEDGETTAAVPDAEATPAPVELVGKYRAFLYGPDHRDESGARHTEAWQVLRQDRINYHTRGERQEADETDPIFGEPANRERMEEAVASGTLGKRGAQKIVEEDVLVDVTIFERDGELARIDVIVF